jgi:hypothetical protein
MSQGIKSIVHYIGGAEEILFTKEVLERKTRIGAAIK